MRDPGERLADRLLGAGVAVLLAAMALYGAVCLIQRIWVVLCLILAVIAIVAVAVLFGLRHFHRF